MLAQQAFLLTELSPQPHPIALTKAHKALSEGVIWKLWTNNKRLPLKQVNAYVAL